ncbi:gamma-glutamylcyclotransferase [Microcoleus sp. FACHB-1515]|nr:gamma-glutamylcyclotransferase [Microcoleus sp. FACHB-1515]
MSLFVYGTLKPGEFFYSRYCEAHLISAQAAIVRGLLFALPLGYPALAAGSDWVQGYLLHLKSDALEAIDELEDYDPTRAAGDNEYERIEVEVFDLAQNSIGKAWTYRMELKRILTLRGHWLPNGMWTGNAESIEF